MGEKVEFVEQVPHYTLSELDDGKTVKLQLAVQLPGITSASDLEVRVLPQHVSLHVPGRYKLDLDLNAPVKEKPELLRFVKKKSVLKAEFLVLEGVPGDSTQAAGQAQVPLGPRRRTSSSEPPRPAVHDSFFRDLLPHSKQAKQNGGPSKGGGSAAASAGGSSSDEPSGRSGSAGPSGSAGVPLRVEPIAANPPALAAVIDGPRKCESMTSNPWLSDAYGHEDATAAAARRVGGINGVATPWHPHAAPPGAGVAAPQPAPAPTRQRPAGYAGVAPGFLNRPPSARSQAAKAAVAGDAEPLLGANTSATAAGAAAATAATSTAAPSRSSVFVAPGMASVADAVSNNGTPLELGLATGPAPVLGSDPAIVLDLGPAMSAPHNALTAEEAQRYLERAFMLLIEGRREEALPLLVSACSVPSLCLDQRLADTLCRTAGIAPLGAAAEPGMASDEGMVHGGMAGTAAVRGAYGLGIVSGVGTLLPTGSAEALATALAAAVAASMAARPPPPPPGTTIANATVWEGCSSTVPQQSVAAPSHGPSAAPSLGASVEAGASGWPEADAGAAPAAQPASQVASAGTSIGLGQGTPASVPAAAPEPRVGTTGPMDPGQVRPASRTATAVAGNSQGQGQFGFGAAQTGASSGGAGQSNGGRTEAPVPGATASVDRVTPQQQQQQQGGGGCSAAARRTFDSRAGKGKHGKGRGAARHGSSGPGRGGKGGAAPAQDAGRPAPSATPSPTPSAEDHKQAPWAAVDPVVEEDYEEDEMRESRAVGALKRLFNALDDRIEGLPSWVRPPVALLCFAVKSLMIFCLLAWRFSFLSLPAVAHVLRQRRWEENLYRISQHRRGWLPLAVNGASLALSAAALLAAASLAWWLLVATLALAGWALSGAWWLTKGAASVLFWSPRWWALWPLSAADLLLTEQRRAPLRHLLWPVPLVVSLCGGRWWSVLALTLWATLFLLSGITPHAAAAAVSVCWCLQMFNWLGAIAGVFMTLVLWFLSVHMTAVAGDRAGGRAGAGGRRYERVNTPPPGASISTDVPQGATGEVARVLAAVDWYEVLEVPRDVDAEGLRKAKNAKSLMTHPDKLGEAVGAKEAFQKVLEAHTVLSDNARRKAYDVQLLQQQAAGRRSSSGGAADGSPTTDVCAGFECEPDTEVSLSIPCPTCGTDHEAILLPLNRDKARYCAKCKAPHRAESGDGWLHSPGGFFSSVRIYACLGGAVLDITEWGRCQGLHLGPDGRVLEANTHHVPMHFGANMPSPQHSRSNKAGRKAGKKARRKR